MLSTIIGLKKALKREKIKTANANAYAISLDIDNRRLKNEIFVLKGGKTIKKKTLDWSWPPSAPTAQVYRVNPNVPATATGRFIDPHGSASGRSTGTISDTIVVQRPRFIPVPTDPAIHPTSTNWYADELIPFAPPQVTTANE